MFRAVKALFLKKPAPELRHPELGVLIFDSDLWSGKVQHDGRDIPFVVGGTALGPNPILLDRLRNLLAGFRDVEVKAVHFLCPQEAPVSPSEFRFHSVDFLWPDRPDCFVMEFTFEGDVWAIWRVEFNEGEPKYTGRDS